VEGNRSAAPPRAYAFLRIDQHRIKNISEQRTTTQIAAAYERFARTAVIKAEMPKAMAIKNPRAAPIQARSPVSW
jgi:hypothetical protein